MQGATERRSEIMKILCRRRSETVGNLAFEFGVSERTIRRDIEVLSLSEPIYTQSGRYGGGVYVEEGYSMYRMYMTETELRVLNKIDGLASAYGLDDGEMQVLHSIISAYTKPGKRNGNFHQSGHQVSALICRIASQNRGGCGRTPKTVEIRYFLKNERKAYGK